LVDEDYRGRFRASGTILESDTHGPVLILGPVMLSLPPRGYGPELVGWSWDTVPHEDMYGARWGEYTVTGYFDGERFTLSEPAVVLESLDPAVWDFPDPASLPGREAVEPLGTPCSAPPEGPRPIDEARATSEAFDQAAQLARADPGFSHLWVDQNLPPGVPNPHDNDRARVILNVATTGDPRELERTLRTVWGGSLRVSKGARTDADLARIQDAVIKTPWALEASHSGRAGQVELKVVRATRQLQAQFDTTYGPGVVNLIGVLGPLD